MEIVPGDVAVAVGKFVELDEIVENGDDVEVVLIVDVTVDVFVPPDRFPKPFIQPDEVGRAVAVCESL